MRVKARRAPEKAEETQGDELMTLLGFKTKRFSQARATMQTPGIADRLYLREPRRIAGSPLDGLGLSVWWEAKDPEKGRQTDAQRGFQADIESLAQPGHVYIVGAFSVLLAWCESVGLVSVICSPRLGALYRVDRTPDPQRRAPTPIGTP